MPRPLIPLLLVLSALTGSARAATLDLTDLLITTQTGATWRTASATFVENYTGLLGFAVADSLDIARGSLFLIDAIRLNGVVVESFEEAPTWVATYGHVAQMASLSGYPEAVGPAASHGNQFLVLNSGDSTTGVVSLDPALISAFGATDYSAAEFWVALDPGDTVSIDWAFYSPESLNGSVRLEFPAKPLILVPDQDSAFAVIRDSQAS